MKFTYLILNLFTLSYPLFRSFENKIKFAQNWKYLFPAIIISGIFFIAWDEAFTRWKVWSFNPEYVIGIFIGHLPLEEILFFITVPFACFFTYEVLFYFFPKTIAPGFFRTFSLIAGIAFAVSGIIFREKSYTAVASFSAAGMMILYALILPGDKSFRLWLSFVVCLVPFLLVNGVLTSLPVVSYNDQENIGIRMGTIPVEDIAYCLSMLSMNFFIIEVLRTKLKFNLSGNEQLSSSTKKI